MSVEFGLTLTGLGVLAMFSALAIIAIACEILKRAFKEAGIEKPTEEVVVKEAPLKSEG